MSMHTEIVKGLWLVETDGEGTTDTWGEAVVPFHVVPSDAATAEAFEPYVLGTAVRWQPQPDMVAARLTMRGYLDSTDWCAYDTAGEALRAMWEHGCPGCEDETLVRETERVSGAVQFDCDGCGMREAVG